MLIYTKMKTKIEEKIIIPEGITCSYQNQILNCKKDSVELSRRINIPKVRIKIEDNSIIFQCNKANKKEIKIIKSFLAHIKNIFEGLKEPFIYKLEAVNVHFPMNLKIEKDYLIVNNFLGESIPRKAKIFSNVNVEIKGQEIIISSRDKEAAGQTMTSIEKATRVKGRDRRIFQDGIFLVSPPEKRK